MRQFYNINVIIEPACSILYIRESVMSGMSHKQKVAKKREKLELSPPLPNVAARRYNRAPVRPRVGHTRS